MLRDNLSIVLAIARAAARAPLAQIVNIGSDAIYADGPVPLAEDSPTAPTTLHGVMHLAREIVLREAVTAPLVLLRPSLLYGAGDPHNGYGPNRFRRLAVKGEPITLFGEGEERRDHVLIDDLAELVRLVLCRRSSGVLNVASGEAVSFRAVAERVAALAPTPVAIRTAPRVGPMPHNGYRPFDIAACRSAFPDFAYTPLNDGLARAQRDEAGLRHERS
jgi:nucleoside-diphosphate-sugar epimerase